MLELFLTLKLNFTLAPYSTKILKKQSHQQTTKKFF